MCVRQAEKLAELKLPDTHADKHTHIFKAVLSQGFFFWLSGENNVASLKINAEVNGERPDRSRMT